MTDFNQQLSEVDQFNTLDDESKLEFGRIYADKLIASDPRFRQDPESAEFLRNKIQTDISAGFTQHALVEQPTILDDENGGLLDEATDNGIILRESKALARGVVKATTQLGQEFSTDIDKYSNFSTDHMVEDLGVIGNDLTNVLMHTAGLAGRAVTGISQLSYWGAGKLLDQTGLGDTSAAKWIKASYQSVAEDRAQMKIFNGIVSEFEPDILAAAATGGIVAKTFHGVIYGAMNKAAVQMGRATLTQADAAILSTAIAATGEATVAAPATFVLGHYIDESGYPEGTKQIMRAVLPIFAGVTSAFTLERVMEMVIRKPFVVNQIVKGVKGGLGPAEVAEETRKIVQPPKPLEVIARQTNDRLPIESTTTYGKNFNVVANFRYGAEFPPIRVGFAAVGPEQIAKAMGQPDVAKTARTVEEAVNHFVGQPLVAARGIQKIIDKKVAAKVPREEFLKLQTMVVKETNRATIAQDILHKLNDPHVDDLLRRAVEGDGAIPRMTQSDILKSDMVEATNARSIVAEAIEQSNNEITKNAAKTKFFDEITDAIAAGKLSESDAIKATSLSDDSGEGWLFLSDPKGVDNALRRIGLTGQENDSLHKWTHAGLHNEGGYATPAFLNTVMLQGLPLMIGWRKDPETGKLKWDANRYMKFGAPMNLALGGGAIWRKVGGNKAVKFGSSKIANKLWDNVAKVPILKRPLFAMRTTEGLIPEAQAIKKQFKVRSRKFAQETDEFVGDLRKKFNKNEMEVMSDFIEQEGNWKNVPELLKHQAKVTQDFLAQIRLQLEDSGIDKELLNKLGDKWLHRVYIPKNLRKRAYKNVRRSMKGIQAHFIDKRGKPKNIIRELDDLGIRWSEVPADQQVFSFIDGKAKRHWVLESQTEKLKQLKQTLGEGREWDVEITKPGEVRVRSDYNRAEREAMGESRDLSVRLQAFFREAGHDITMGNIFREVSANPKLVMQPKDVDKPFTKLMEKKAKKLGFVKMPDTKTHSGINKFGLLNKKWVHPDVATTLKAMTSKRFEDPFVETIWNLNKKAVKGWKIAKTAYNPPTHVINSFSNVILTGLSGHNPVTVPLEGLMHLVDRGEVFQKLVKAGLKDSGIIKGEWDATEFARATDGLTGVPEDAGLITKALHLAFKGGKEFVKLPQHLYQWEDEIFKLGLASAEMRKGLSPEDALAQANKWFFDYSDVPEGVQFLRDSGAVPFISWTYKIIPAIARTARDHPERIALFVLGVKALNDIMYEEQFGKKAKAQAALEQELRPEFQKKTLFGSKVSTQVRLMGDAETSVARSLDVGGFSPGSDLFTNIFQGFPFGTHPLVGLVSGFVNNRAPFTGDKIIPYVDPKNAFEESENMDGRFKFIINHTLPNVPFIPYTYSNERVGNVLVGTGDINEDSGWVWAFAQRRGWTGKDYLGNDLNVFDETATSLGIPIRRLDVPKATEQQLKMRGQAVKSARSSVIKHLGKDVRTFHDTPARREKIMQGEEPQFQRATQDLDVLLGLLEKAD